MRRGALKALLTSLAGFALLGTLLWRFDARAVTQALADADLLLVALTALGATAINTVQSAAMLRRALATFGIDIPFRLAFRATFGSLTLQAVLPLSTGQLGRAAYIAQESSTDLLRGSLAAALILALKLAMLLVLSGAGWLLHPEASPVRGPVLVAFVVAVALAAWLAPVLIHRLALRFGAVPKVGRLLLALDQARRELRWGALLATTVHAFISVGSELVVFGLLLRAVGASVDPLSIGSLFPLVVIGAKVPVTVLGVGTREALVLALFHGLASPVQLLSAALLFSCVEHLLPALIGLLLTGPFLSKLLAGGRVQLLGEPPARRQ